MTISTIRLPIWLACGLILGVIPAFSQDLEPRRWSHLPIGSNFGGIGYAYTEGDISFNPVLRFGDGTFDLQTLGLKYIHALGLLEKSGHFDLTQAYQGGIWSGLIDGVPASVPASVGVGYGGENTIDGVSTGDREFNIGWGLSMGIPVNRSFGFRVGYIGIRTQEDTGADTDTLTIACSYQPSGDVTNCGLRRDSSFHNFHPRKNPIPVPHSRHGLQASFRPRRPAGRRAYRG